MTPTDEQAAILDAVKSTTSSIMIQAYAGTGKSATLRLIDDADETRPKLYLVFNKRNATEAEGKFADTTTVRTFNSIGHRIWTDYCSSRPKLNPKKLSDIFRAIVDDAPKSDRTEIWQVYDLVMQGVNNARSLGYIPTTHQYANRSLIDARVLYKSLDESPSQFVKELIDQALLESIRQAFSGVIDFADQCYMPALFGGNYPRFPVVMVDEYQDLSPVQHEIIRKLAKRSRLIGVGDVAQSIYGFRGAKIEGMDDAIREYSMQTFTLSVSFRCPSEIVHNVQWRVPNFKASRIGGKVIDLGSTHTVVDGAAVICRNNAPLFKHALNQLANGRSVDVSGTNMGAQIIRQMTKLGPDSMTQAQALSSIDQWESEKLENESKTAKEMADCMRVFARTASTLGGAIAYAKHLFAQTGTIQYLTGHKSKGLEFDHVYHLDREILKHDGQDPNVHYVIDTRAKETLSYINGAT